MFTKMSKRKKQEALSPGFPDSMVIVDTETTGGKATRDRLTEIAIIRIEQGHEVWRWSSLINPEISIPPWIEKLTGIRQEMVNSAPTFAELADEIESRLSGAVFIAHNARFDHGFIKNEFKRLGRFFKAKTLCSVKLSRRFYPQYKRHSLDQIIKRLGVVVESRHRAMDDAAVVLRLMQTISSDYGHEEIKALVEAVLKKPSLPSYIDVQEIERLPNTPGVYRFYDDKGGLLYVGKSVNVRDRVMSHFTQDHAVAKDLEMSGLIRHVDFTETPSDFGAQLLESMQIKQLKPRYNRKLRKITKLYQIVLEPDEMGYLTCQIVAIGLNERPSSARYGLFRSLKQAQKWLETAVKEHQLCHRLTGLEKRQSGPCFAHQLKHCKGACCGKESAEIYNLRLQMALSQLKSQVWPWNGPVLVKEGDVRHLVDQWVYYGQVRDEHELEEALNSEPAFDLDAYLILIRFLVGPARDVSLEVKCLN